MNLYFPFVATALLLLLHPLRGALNEETILLFASLLFFGVLFSRIRDLASGFLFDQLDQIYSLYATLLDSRLLRLASILGFSRRLVGLILFLRCVPLLLSLLFHSTPPPPLPNPLAAVRREGISSILLSEQQRVARCSSLLRRSFPLFKNSMEMDFKFRTMVAAQHLLKQPI